MPLARLEGKYEILEKIREGGMGAVYKVRHRLLEEVRVVKVMRPHLADDKVLQERFLREAKVAIRLRHPNLAQIYDFTVDDNGYAYLVMEFIDGLNLQEVVKVLGTPGLGLVLEIARQSLEALGYLHRKRIVHRDVSPDNILVTRDDERALLIKLIDLGIAKVREGDDSLTSEGTFLGKVRYSSPEHFKTAEGPGISAASDLYSFGVVLYELLTGMYPIQGTSVASLISGHLVHPPLDFETSDPDGRLPEDLRAVVRKALEKDPTNRFGSSTSFSKALQPWIERYPLDAEEFQTIFDLPTVTTHKMRTVKPGSTQSRIDRSFGLSTTPPPGEDTDGDTEFETSGTVETGSADRARTPGKAVSKQAQIRALLAGAGKLAEGGHFEEARMQLASVLDLDIENVEARELQRAVDDADVVLKKKRQDAAERIRLLVRAESFERAAIQLGKAVEDLGQAELFEQLRDEITTARQASEERQQKVREILSEATALIEKEAYEEAVPMLRQGLDLDSGNRELIAKLETAEKGFEAVLAARRRAREVEDAVATILSQIEARDVDQAEHALKLAEKLYGPEDTFEDLRVRIDQIRCELVLEKAKELRDQAQKEIEKQEFDVAIALLEDAGHLVPDEAKTEELLSAAREGIRQREAARERQKAIDASIVKIERLIAVGRFQSAIDAIDAVVDEFGDFDQAAALRKQVSDQTEALEKAAAEVESLLDQALERAGSEASAEALDIIDQAREHEDAYPFLGQPIADAEIEVHRRIEAHRRQMAIDNVISSVEQQLDNGATEEAHRELGVARRLYGNTDVLDELGAKIEAHQRQQRFTEIDELVKSAHKKKRSHEDAVADLEAALSIDPHAETAHRLLFELRSACKRSAEENLAQECEARLATIDGLIAEGQPEKALHLLEEMVQDVGDFQATRDLRRALGELV